MNVFIYTVHIKYSNPITNLHWVPEAVKIKKKVVYQTLTRSFRHFKTADSLILPEATERTAAMGVPKSAATLCGYKFLGKEVIWHAKEKWLHRYVVMLLNCNILNYLLHQHCVATRSAWSPTFHMRQQHAVASLHKRVH